MTVLTARAGPDAATAGGPAGSDVAGEPRGRDPWLDNVRLLAAIFILTNHAVGQVIDRSATMPILYLATWPLRVPLFVIVAGYFSSARALSGRRAMQLLRNILFVYLTVDFVAMVHRGLSKDIWRWEPSFPAFGMWFLLSLFCWRLVLPLLAHLRFLFPVSVLAALGVGFFAGFGPEFSASRTVVYLPVFLLGWRLRQVGLRDLLDRRAVRAAAVAVLLGIGVAAVFLADDVSRRWLGMNRAYRGDLVQQLTEAGIRGLALMVGALGALALIALIPRRRIPVISYLGSGSMYIYILHAMIIQQLMTLGYFRSINSRPELLLMLLGCLALGLLLASPPIRWAFRWLVQPRYRWLFRER